MKVADETVQQTTVANVTKTQKIESTSLFTNSIVNDPEIEILEDTNVLVINNSDEEIQDALIIPKIEPKDQDEYSVELSEELPNKHLETPIKEEPKFDEFEDDIIILNNKQDLFSIIGNIEREDKTRERFVSHDDNNRGTLIQRKKRNQRIYNCIKCKFRGTHKKYQIHKFKYHCIGSIIPKTKCSVCKVDFKDEDLLAEHLQGSSCFMKCALCNYEAKTNNKNYKNHVWNHIKFAFIKVHQFDEKGQQLITYKCVKCRTILLFDDLIEHWNMHVNSGDDCVTVVKETDGLKISGLNENKIHLNNDFVGSLPFDKLQSVLASLLSDADQKTIPKCLVCDKYVPKLRKSEYKRHLIEHLLFDAFVKKPALLTLKCQLCGFDAINAMNYKQHMREHGHLAQYKCPICQKSFSDSSNFCKHKKVHQLNHVTCDLCKKKFTSKKTLIRHLEVCNF